MARIVLARDLQHEQIEFPKGTPHPKGRRGGAAGSLHLRRGSIRDVTSEELAYIKASRPEVFKCLDVLPEPKNSPALARKLRSIGVQKAREQARKEAAASAASEPPKADKPTAKRKKKATPEAG